MNTRLLIDSIVQQTTVLIAQLSTAAGLRAPLSHVADQVFLSLAQEIERQGVGRKVVADMFGLALRSYQRKVQRLEESGAIPGKTLWEAMLGYITESGPVHRDTVLERFRLDDELAVSAVLADLVASGVVYSSGRGEATVYGVTSDADRKALSGAEGDEALALLVWGMVFRSPGANVAELCLRVRAPESDVRRAIGFLLADGRLSRPEETDTAPLSAASFVIPTGSTLGWEAAVFDHYQALANAVVSKLGLLSQEQSVSLKQIGGTTLHFGIEPGHPFEERVLGLLERTRAELGELWKELSEYNKAHPLADDVATRVTFYFGQNVRRPTDGSGAAPKIAFGPKMSGNP